jgi:integrase
LPVLGEREVRAVERADLAALLHGMAYGADPKPVETNRTFTSLHGLFRWCAEVGLRDDDPALLLRKPVKAEPSAVRQREGTEPLLDTLELAQLWRAAATVNSTVLGDLLRCLLLVPLRRDEWTDLTWAELRDSFTADGWTGAALCIPATRMKGRRLAVVPLPPQAMAILAARRKITGQSANVFSVPGRNNPFNGWKRAAATLRQALGSRNDWSPHTIRKSVATAMVRDLKADELLVGRVLQHSPKAALGVTAIYQRSARIAEQAELLTRWAAHLEAAAAILDGNGVAEQVVPLGARVAL